MARQEADASVDTASIGLDGLSAYIDFVDGDTDRALDLLAGKTDPQSIRSTLAILLRTGKYSGAAETIRSLVLHERWCDLAVASFVANGEMPAARQVIVWSSTLSNRMV